jgi:hypothetical protein
MKHVKLFEDFIIEKKPNVKKNVKKINKKIGTQVKKAEKEMKKVKDLSDSPEVKDKMSATLAKIKNNR